MHPSHVDIEYMQRVIKEAQRYDFDSFGICGPFAHHLGGMNGGMISCIFDFIKQLSGLNRSECFIFGVKRKMLHNEVASSEKASCFLP